MQIAMDSTYTVKIANFLLFVANSDNYLRLSIVVHYKTVHNNNILSANDNFNSNY